MQFSRQLFKKDFFFYYGYGQSKRGAGGRNKSAFNQNKRSFIFLSADNVKCTKKLSVSPSLRYLSAS